MNRRYFVLPFALMAFAVASAEECSTLKAYAAETVVDYLDSWKNVHLAYKQFRKCDDASVAEGYSDAVAVLLSKKWDRLGELKALIRADPGFEAFVLRHLDETIDDNDRRVIEQSAKKKCPRKLQTLCTKLLNRVASLGP